MLFQVPLLLNPARHRCMRGRLGSVPISVPGPLAFGTESQGAVVEIYPYKIRRPFKNKSRGAFTSADIRGFTGDSTSHPLLLCSP